MCRHFVFCSRAWMHFACFGRSYTREQYFFHEFVFNRRVNNQNLVVLVDIICQRFSCLSGKWTVMKFGYIPSKECLNSDCQNGCLNDQWFESKQDTIAWNSHGQVVELFPIRFETLKCKSDVFEVESLLNSSQIDELEKWCLKG